IPGGLEIPEGLDIPGRLDEMTGRLGKHAIVIGGSVAGLMSARVLSDFFDRVTVFERDQIEDRPAIHKSIPQGNHVHTLLLSGQQVMSSFFPGFIEEMKRSGAVPARAGIDFVFYGPDGKSYTGTDSVREPRDLGFVGHTMSRGLLEHLLRQRVTALANVKLEKGIAVEGLLNDHRQVRGVRAAGSRSVEADLVVDAGGRSSHAPRWLIEMGMPTPEETTIGVDFAYTSTKFRKTDYYLEPLAFVGGAPPNTVGGAVFEIENDTRHVSLFGRFGVYPPTSEDGFLAFAKALPSPQIYEAIRDTKRLTDITHHRFPTSVRRHYERLAEFPDNLILVGDAVACFNPVYGQGMSSAALQARALQQILGERAADSRGLTGLSSAFFKKTADVIDVPWTLAANSDFAFPQTRGERPPGLAEGARYFMALDSIVAEDIEVQRLTTEVFQLTKPMSALLEEPLRSRVMARLLQLAPSQ
ncbi:MAG: FAD-dependent oxidoreductase, partial [Steroidobacteraceae bacterium]